MLVVVFNNTAFQRKGWEYTVFNTMDQPVATQDANQQANNQWIFTKYDVQGRVIETGIWNNGGMPISRANLQALVNNQTVPLWERRMPGNYYTTTCWPTSWQVTFGINCYDDYSFPNLPAAYAYSTARAADLPAVNGPTRSLPTGTLTWVVNQPGVLLWNINYYDNLGRNIQTYKQHYLGGTLSNNNYDAVSSTYNFTNAATTVTRQHWNNASTTAPLVTIANTYIYDHEGRKMKSWEKITNGNSSPTTKTLLSQTVYNEVGQVMDKQLHSTDSVTFYQNIAYNHNERGWLTNSSAPLFSMQLLYNTAAAGKQYNGNIAYQSWVNPYKRQLYLYIR